MNPILPGNYATGDKVFKDYILKRYLGQGGYGQVYLVENRIGLPAALKILHKDVHMEQRGIESVMQLRSNRLVAILDFGHTCRNEACVLMEYVPRSLAEIMGAGPLKVEQARKYLIEILKGLLTLQQNAILHRDIKPANLFVLEDIVKIGDFGTARYTSGESTAMSVVAGTVHYMAPERFRPGHGFAVDRWAAAVVFYRMLTHRYPFDGRDQTEIFGAILQQQPDLDRVPSEYRHFFHTCFQKSVRDRHPDTEHMLAHIDGCSMSTIERLPKAEPNCLQQNFVGMVPGTFIMGSPPDEKGRNDNETQYEVTLTRPFYIQTTPVTVGQWRIFAHRSGYRSDAEQRGGAWVWTGRQWQKRPGLFWQSPGFGQSDQHPVTCVSWNDVGALTAWLNRQDGREYRLPTEAQWEYACRAGHSGRFGFDTRDAELDQYAWYWLSADKKTHPVATKKANAWGLYDMHGNVWEWCQSWYGDYPRNAATDPQGPFSGAHRIWRGGSWSSSAENCRSAKRRWAEPAFRYFGLGFRLALMP